MATAEATTYENPQSLGDLNRMLVRLGFSVTTHPDLQKIMDKHPRKRLVDALNMAPADPHAMTYLKSLFGLKENNAPPPRTSHPPERNHRNSPARMQQRATGTQNEKNENLPGKKQSAQETRERIYKHVYGGSAALCFSVDETRSGYPTVCIDAADNIAPREYNWTKKISIQLTKQELPVVAAVFLGLISKAEYSSHGPAKDKGFSIEDQGDKIFVQVRAKDQKVKSVPITPEDAFYVAQLFIRQLRLAAPWMNGMDILSCLRMALASRKAK